MRLARSSAIVLGLVAALGLTACGDDGTDPETDPAASGSSTGSTTPSASDDAMSGDATFTATEYGFDGPDTLPAGKVTITLVNEGEEPHEMALFPVEEGRGPEDVLEYIEENPELDGPPPPWVIGEGTGTFAKPGKTAKPVSAKLEPGTYLAVCFVSTKQSDDTPHAALGMISEITVG
jgi:hypothetical protein